MLHMYAHTYTHSGDYQHLELTEADNCRMKLQEQSRNHEEELMRVRGTYTKGFIILCVPQCTYVHLLALLNTYTNSFYPLGIS